MKLVMVIHNSALKSNVLEVFEKNRIKKYTQIDEVKGRGESSEPHLGTHVWPGINSITFSVVKDENAYKKLLTGLREIKEKFRSEGVKVFVLPVEEEI
jgi:nitrogen regulatory protein PII